MQRLTVVIMATVWEEAANEALYKEYSSERQVT